MNSIIYAVSVDVNNPITPYNVYVANVLDSNVRYLEITLYENGNVITLSNTATATASLVTDNVLVDDSVECTISNNIISVPLEDLQRHGNLDVQVTVTEGIKVLAIPFPIQVRVTPNIAENAQIDENSLGSYAEVVHEITEARGTHTTLHDAISAKLDDSDGSVKTANLADESITVEKVANDLAAVINAKAPLSTTYTFDTTTTNVVYNANNPKTIYLNAHVDNKDAFVLTTANNYYQIALCYDGTEYKRELTSSGAVTYTAWAVVNNESSSNKQSSITAVNKASTTQYPSIKAVVDYLVANYEALSNKLTSEEGIDSGSTDTEYPTAKAVYDYGTTITNNIENLEAIPCSVKLAMDTLFSKAAYADDDAASSYATFHAWAMMGSPFISATQGNITFGSTDADKVTVVLNKLTFAPSEVKTISVDDGYQFSAFAQHGVNDVSKAGTPYGSNKMNVYSIGSNGYVQGGDEATYRIQISSISSWETSKTFTNTNSSFTQEVTGIGIYIKTTDGSALTPEQAVNVFSIS